MIQGSAKVSVKIWASEKGGEWRAATQVVAILESGEPLPFTIQAADLDLPELQGEPEAIAREKCRLAAEQVLHPLIARMPCCICKGCVFWQLFYIAWGFSLGEAKQRNLYIS